MSKTMRRTKNKATAKKAKPALKSRNAAKPKKAGRNSKKTKLAVAKNKTKRLPLTTLKSEQRKKRVMLPKTPTTATESKDKEFVPPIIQVMGAD